MVRQGAVLLGLMFTGASYASGLYLYEMATEDLGLAGAGQAARAGDASTLVTNPAGLTRLSGNMLTGGIQALYGDTNYQLDNDALLQGKSPGNTIGWFPASSVFWRQQINDRVSAGLGLYGNYGLGLDFGNWAGDALLKKSTLLAMTLSPAVGWKLSDRVSVGAGVGINYGFLSLTRDASGEDRKQTDHDWALNYRLGILFDLTPQTRVGLTYTSKTDYHFNINNQVRIAQLSNTTYVLPISADVSTPAQLMLSAVYDINPRWSVMGDLGWQDWSAYSNSQIYVASNAVEGNSRLRDTWHTALGLQFRPTPDWHLNTGVAYDSSFYRSQSDTSLTMPSGNTWRFGVGAQYQLSNTQQIGAAFEYADVQSSSVSSPLVKGGYHNPALYFFSMNFTQTF